jgi:hypothetical protein
MIEDAAFTFGPLQPAQREKERTHIVAHDLQSVLSNFDSVLLSIDITNAFNSIRRSTILQAIREAMFPS